MLDNARRGRYRAAVRVPVETKIDEDTRAEDRVQLLRSLVVRVSECFIDTCKDWGVIMIVPTLVLSAALHEP